MSLYEKLCEYGASQAYPFHMPGHKRQETDFPNPYRIDITEIDGFDNLHHAEGLLQEAQREAAALYGVPRAWYLINGSTCGLLAAISAALPKGAEVLVARNCHKAVYHALQLRELKPHYIYPELTHLGLQGQVKAEAVERALEEHPGAKALILTSPTYDGVLSDVEGIAEILHRRNALLILDQAHGAHFGLDAVMPESGARLGADLVIVSLHKTLPCFTQTALLLQASDRVAAERLEEYLDIYETSSPSYLLMAGIEQGLALVKEEGRQRFAALRERLDRFYERMQGLKYLQVVRPGDFTSAEAYDFDDSKILIFPERAGMDGGTLAGRLRRDFGLEVEMTTATYVLALCSLMDTEEGFRRLAEALEAIDREAEAQETERRPDHQLPESRRENERSFEIHEKEGKFCRLLVPEEAVGETAMDYIYLYPPGIPLVVPGEMIPEWLPGELKRAQDAGIEINGPAADGMLRVWDRTR